MLSAAFIIVKHFYHNAVYCDTKPKCLIQHIVMLSAAFIIVKLSVAFLSLCRASSDCVVAPLGVVMPSVIMLNVVAPGDRSTTKTPIFLYTRKDHYDKEGKSNFKVLFIDFLINGRRSLNCQKVEYLWKRITKIEP